MFIHICSRVPYIAGVGKEPWSPWQDPTSVVFLDIDGVLRRLRIEVRGTGGEIRPLDRVPRRPQPNCCKLRGSKERILPPEATNHEHPVVEIQNRASCNSLALAATGRSKGGPTNLQI